jgi:transposase
LREFLGLSLKEDPPDHSSLSRTRRLMDLETHQRVFRWILKLLATQDLVKGKTVGIDATTLEANAALRSIVRRDTGETYEQFLTRLAKASGIETPTRQDLAKLDKNRKNKGSNDDWEHPHDPDAKITKMKDGRTHLAHKHEQAIDFDSGVVLGVTVQPADEGDTTTWRETFEDTCQNINTVKDDPLTAEGVNKETFEELVTDKGYHSNQTMVDWQEIGVRTYVSEPDRGRRNWIDKEAERETVYANRRRIRGPRGKRLLRRRGELLERGFAHELNTGGMRRTHLRGHQNILKRMLIHVGGFNLGLLMRKLTGTGTPRSLQGLCSAIFRVVRGLCEAFGDLPCRFTRLREKV